MFGARFLKYWLPVLIWMTIIFSASTDLMSARHTSRFIGPILRWFKPDISDEAVWKIQKIIRKGGHVTEYAVLGLLIWRARRMPTANDSRPWLWKEAVFAILICALYAASDESHQYFVATRQASVWDVILDTTGATLGLIILWRTGAWRKVW